MENIKLPQNESFRFSIFFRNITNIALHLPLETLHNEKTLPYDSTDFEKTLPYPCL